MKTSLPKPSQIRNTKIKLLLTVLFFFFFSIVHSQLSGDFTIGSGSDYTTFSAAAEALHTQGVSGPVVFNVISGTYNEQFTLDYVPYASESNTITFQSQTGDSTEVVIKYDAEGNDDNFLVTLKRCSYVTLKGITFWALDDMYNRIITIEDYAEYLSIEHCLFKGTYNTNAIVRSAHIQAQNALLDHLTINNNRFSRGSYGIVFNSSSKNNLYPDIKYNRFDSLGYCAINLNTSEAPAISYNTIGYSSIGIFITRATNATIIQSNKLININHTGMDFRNLKSAPGYESLVSNNMVAANQNGGTGIKVSSSNYLDIIHNTIMTNRDYFQSKVLSLEYCTGSTINILNNNLVSVNDGYALFVNNTGNLNQCDYNNFYTPGRIFAYWNDQKECEDFRTLKEASQDNVHSIFAYPYFISETNLHAQSAWLDGKGVQVPEVTNDLDGVARTNPPDIGCYEFTASDEVKSPLSGIKTIGSGGDYASVQEAITDVRVRGVSDALRLQVLSGTYEEQCIITPIAGASSVHPVILESATGNPEDVNIRYEATGAEDNYVFKLRGSSFLQIRNLSIEATGSRYCNVLELKGMVDSLQVDSCMISGTHQGDANPTGRLVNSDYLNFHYMSFNNNTFRDGSTSLLFNLSKPTSLPGEMILSGNLFPANGYQAIYLFRVESPVISNNRIPGSDYGISISHASKGLLISKNYIHTVYGSGIDLNACSFPQDMHGRIYNNFIVNNGDHANRDIMEIMNCKYIKIYYNTVSSHSVTSKSRPLYIYGGQDLSVINNIFSNEGTEYAINVMNVNPSTFSSFDYNCFYSEGTALGYWNQECTDLDAIKAASGKNEHSVFANPVFVADTNLHVTSYALDGVATPVSWITTDYDGDARDVQYPDIGADEFGVVENNPPIAVNDTITTAVEITIYPLLNDDDIDDDTITITKISAPNQGTASIMEGDTTILYTPVSYSPQHDTIQYIIQDNNGGLDTAYIYITLYRLMTGFTRMDYDIRNISHGSGKFGDYDNDGDLDILMTGWMGTNQDYISSIYKNTGGNFEEMQAGLSGVSPGTPNAASWIDYDNDNDLDLIIMGRLNNTLNEYSTVIYENIENSFTESADASIEVNMSSGSVDWGDYNNDGKYDLLISGKPESSNSVTEVYKNLGADPDGKWKLEKVETNLTGIWGGASNWVDFDSDGDLDIFICGFGADPSELYRNDNGTFNLITTDIAGVGNAASDWGDYDSDGDMDLILTGGDQTYLSKIYRNDGSSGEGQWTFTDINANLEQINGGDVAWGDFDNDGDLDLVLSGNITALTSISVLYKNDNGSFVNANEYLIDMGRSAIALGDYDNDGDLDLLMSGYSPSQMQYLSILYQNNTTETNEAPSPPLNLTAFEHGDTITFSWDQSQDDHTISDALTYNLRIGTEAGKNDILSPMSSSEGFRKIVNIGNTGHSISWDIRGLPGETTYYWSVQAVDQAFMGSEFASEQSIMFTTIDENVFNTFNLEQIYPNPFNNATNIRFSLQKQADSRIEIYDLTGQKIIELLNNNLAAGTHEITWQANNCPSGIYFLKLSVGNQIAIKKVVKMK